MNQKPTTMFLHRCVCVRASGYSQKPMRSCACSARVFWNPTERCNKSPALYTHMHTRTRANLGTVDESNGRFILQCVGQKTFKLKKGRVKLVALKVTADHHAHSKNYNMK